MKTEGTLLVFFSVVFAGAILIAQEPPIKDFRLPNDELVTIFIGGNNWQAPYLQCVNLVDQQYVFYPLFEGAAQDVSHGSDFYYETSGTAGNFDGKNETNEIILGTASGGRIILHHTLCNQQGFQQATKLFSSINSAEHPCLVSGYFTPEAKSDNREEVVIGTNYDQRYVRLYGFRYSSAGTEVINRFFNEDFISSGSKYMPPVDIAAGDFDGDQYSELCYVCAFYSKTAVIIPPNNTTWNTSEEIIVGALDWTPPDANPIQFPFGSPQEKKIKKWTRTASSSSSPLDIFTSEHLCRICVADVNNDGKDDVVVLRDLVYTGGGVVTPPKSGLQITIYSYNTETKQWSRMELKNVKGTLLDNEDPWKSMPTRKTEHDNIQLKAGDLDNNGCDDIAASITYETSTKTALHYWLYTFELDATEGLIVRENLNDHKDDTGLKHSMAVSNMDGDRYGEIYYVTETPKLYSVTFDTTMKVFKPISEISTAANNYNYSAHGFTFPVLLPVDIDNDSYWCRYKEGLFDSQSSTPFIGKPVAIITPPPFAQSINNDTKIDIKFSTAHDTSASVQTQTGYGYDLEISAGVKWLGTKTVFETIYNDTVVNNNSYYEGNADNDYWQCHNQATQVIFPTTGYDIYPFRIESYLGEPIKSEGKELFIYLLKPKDSGTHLQMQTWENYISMFEDSYGVEEKNKLASFMMNFMHHSSGDVASYTSNANPYFLYANLEKAFPTLEQEINTSHYSYQKEWGKTVRTDESCKRSQRWQNIFTIKAGNNWGVVNAGANLRLNFFTTTKELTESSNEDGILIRITFQGVGTPNTPDDNKFYNVISYAFWGPDESVLEGAVIITHQVTKLGSYYDTGTRVNKNSEQIPKDFSLSQNYPNPFNSKTRISFAVPKPANVRIEIYNFIGQKVKILYDQFTQPGYYDLIWQGDNGGGQQLGTATYFCKIVADGYEKIQKMVLIR